MTIPYCCHIISQIEVEYASSTDLPKWLIKSFTNPRTSGITVRRKDDISKLSDPADLRELYSICDSFLQKYGYSMKHFTKNDSPFPVPPAISDCPYRKDSLEDQYKSSNSESSSDSEPPVGTGISQDPLISKTNEVVKSLLQSTITKSMVYYLSLYEEFSKNYDLLNISKKSYVISKNSTYEMITGLRDCLAHLYDSLDHENEAIIITNDYSGIFSCNEVLITRSNLTFRDDLRQKGIKYSTIYDEISRRQSKNPDLTRSYKDFSELVNSYLKNEFKTGKSRSKMYRSKLDLKYKGRSKDSSKYYFLKSLKLPMSDDYDVSVIRVKGRSNCHKLFRFMDKACMNNLLAMQNEKFSSVRLILTNFPTLFSKVNQARFSFTRENDVAKMVIRGLIMPSVLKNCFDTLKLLESSELVAKPTIKIKYNLTFDDEMYEKTLRVSENRIYDHFVKNFAEIRKKYTHTYRALKKLVPFNKFTLCNGHVTISQASTSLYPESGRDKILRLENRSSSSMEIATLDSGLCSEILLVRDTLYYSLSKVRLYLSNMEGTASVLNNSTKAFLDDAFQRVFYAHLRDLEFEDSPRCYVELYPNEENSTKDPYKSYPRLTDGAGGVDPVASSNEFPAEISKPAHALVGAHRWHDIQDPVFLVLSQVMPHNLVSVLWVLAYLMHCSGYSEMLDTAALENLTNHDIYRSTPTKFPLQTRRLPGSLDLQSTLNFPLSQQSYLVHLVNHINFNRDFHRVFRTKYTQYLANSKNQASAYETAKVQILDSTVNLTSGWKSFFKQKSISSQSTIEESVEINGTGSTELAVDAFNAPKGADEDKASPKTPSNNKFVGNSGDRQPVEPRLKGTVVPKLVHNANNSKAIQTTFNLDFATVRSSSRKHGRVHHCEFDFDTHNALEAMYQTSRSNILEELSSIIRKETTAKQQDTTHFVIVFMFSNDPCIQECVNLKMFKHLLRSNLLKLSPQRPTYQALDLTQLNPVNVNKFRNMFTDHEFASGSRVMLKNGVSYSVFSSDLNVKQLHSALSQVHKATQIKIMAIPLLSGELQNFSRSCLKLSNVNGDLKGAYRSTLDFVSISWIFDSYFQGMLQLDSIPEEYLLQYTPDGSTQYSLEDFSIQDFREDTSSQFRLTLDELTLTQLRFSSQESCPDLSQFTSSFDCSRDDTLSQTTYQFDLPTGNSQELDPLEYTTQEDANSLAFREEYRRAKFLWGWTVYLLAGSGPAVSEHDCTLYRRLCGIAVKTFQTMDDIRRDIEATTLRVLSLFGIGAEDVAEFLTHSRILTNSIVVSPEGSMPSRHTHTGPCVCPSIGNKIICFGAYPGIPVLSHRWLINTLRSAQ